ncbi:hypothetical protein JPFTNV_07390 [Francisella tularensis subsp. holarctica]|nr:hypothetical protein JPFTNV_07390 [Francisella tularensis subsp. holarctica]BCL55292.1 hypothetical protein JPFTKU_11060 [Francisella tularensis subsp. holarctica]
MKYVRVKVGIKLVVSSKLPKLTVDNAAYVYTGNLFKLPRIKYTPPGVALHCPSIA